MKLHTTLAAISLFAQVSIAQTPKVFSGLFEQDVPVKGQIGGIIPPPEIDKYVAKVEAASRKDPKWFKEFSAQTKPGIPLPYDERLGLTQAEYQEYLALWAKREFKPNAEVMLLLRQSSSDAWVLTSTGAASVLSTLRYAPKEDVFRSPNGEMKRLEDIKAESNSILGEWTGHEWKFEEETGLGKTKENFAFGRLADKKYGVIIYRAQELSSEGTKLLDKSLVIRFPLGKAAAVTKETKPAKK